MSEFGGGTDVQQTRVIAVVMITVRPGSAKKRPLAHSKKAPEGANVVRKLGFMNIATNETRFRAVYLMRHHLPVFLISHYQDDATLG